VPERGLQVDEDKEGSFSVFLQGFNGKSEKSIENTRNIDPR
jgi:hypothetical protein